MIWKDLIKLTYRTRMSVDNVKGTREEGARGVDVIETVAEVEDDERACITCRDNSSK